MDDHTKRLIYWTCRNLLGMTACIMLVVMFFGLLALLYAWLASYYDDMTASLITIVPLFVMFMIVLSWWKARDDVARDEYNMSRTMERLRQE